MKGKYFKSSYQTVKDTISFLSFILVVWYISAKYVWRLKDSTTVGNVLYYLSIDTPLELTIYLLIFVASVWLLYHVVRGIIDRLYWLFAYKTGQSEWYPFLTHTEIRIPITKKDYWFIKDCPVFMVKFPENKKAEYNFTKLKDWATKLIEKEINILRKGGKGK